MLRHLTKSGRASNARKKLIKLMVPEADKATLRLTPQTQEGGPAETVLVSTVIATLLKQLDYENLLILCNALEWSDQGETSCVPMDTRRRDRCQLSDQVDPIVAVCKAWRWVDLDHAELLGCLPFCRLGRSGWGERHQICINPYHWSRLAAVRASLDSKLSPSNGTTEGMVWGHPRLLPPLSPQTAPHSACSTASSAFSHSSLSSACSSLTSHQQQQVVGHARSQGVGGEESKGRAWCHLSHWSLMRHLGSGWVPVFTDVYHVPHDTGSISHVPSPAPMHPLCCLTPPSEEPCISQPLGPGLSLIRGPGPCLWIYNRSSRPLFISSPTLAAEGDSDADKRTAHDPCRDWPVCRLPPGHALAAFDPASYSRLRSESTREGACWPGHTLAASLVHVSWGKGWGPGYRRPDVTHCPARLEILVELAPASYCPPASPLAPKICSISHCYS